RVVSGVQPRLANENQDDVTSCNRAPDFLRKVFATLHGDDVHKERVPRKCLSKPVVQAFGEAGLISPAIANEDPTSIPRRSSKNVSHTGLVHRSSLAADCRQAVLRCARTSSTR